MSDRATYQQYLLSKGLSPTQVGGILLNIEDESGFSPNPGGSNDQGMAYGLFQHYGPRRDALFRYAGTSSPSWKQQIDYALTEPDMASYLARDYSNYGEAAVAFLRGFERPAEKHAKARAAKYLANHSNDVAPDGYTIPASAITGDPSAYSGGSIMPVSAIPPGPPPPNTQLAPQQPQGLLGGLDPALGGLIGMSMLAGAFGGGQRGGMGGALASVLPLLMSQQGKALAAPKMGTTTVKRGDQEITYLTKDGVPVQEIGTAPRWQPPEIEDSAPTYGETTSRINALRSQYGHDADRANFVMKAWDRVRDINPDAAGGIEDQTLITMYAKMNDPTSVVMGGEQESIQKALKESTVFREVYDSYISGKRKLSPNQRRKILSEMQRIARTEYPSAVTAWSRANERASRQQINPLDVVPRSPPSWTPYGTPSALLPREEAKTVPDRVQEGIQEAVEGVIGSPGGVNKPPSIRMEDW